MDQSKENDHSGNAQHFSRLSVFYYILLALSFVLIIFLAFVNHVIVMSGIYLFAFVPFNS